MDLIFSTGRDAAECITKFAHCMRIILWLYTPNKNFSLTRSDCYLLFRDNECFARVKFILRRTYIQL
jgi:hypothetical protein